jgi:hypothetical protein
MQQPPAGEAPRRLGVVVLRDSQIDSISGIRAIILRPPNMLIEMK